LQGRYSRYGVKLLLSSAGSPSKVCQPPDHIIFCRMKSGKKATQLHQRGDIDWVLAQKHRSHAGLALSRRKKIPQLFEQMHTNSPNLTNTCTTVGEWTRRIQPVDHSQTSVISQQQKNPQNEPATSDGKSDAGSVDAAENLEHASQSASSAAVGLATFSLLEASATDIRRVRIPIPSPW